MTAFHQGDKVYVLLDGHERVLEEPQTVTRITKKHLYVTFGAADIQRRFWPDGTGVNAPRFSLCPTTN